MKKKTVQKSEKIGRRDFLKKGCEVAASAMLFVGLLPFQKAQANVEKKSPHPKGNEDYDWAEHLYAYVIDTRKCIGCGMCVEACRKENNVPEGFFRTWVERYDVSEDGQVKIDSPKGGEEVFDITHPGFDVSKGYFVPKMCNHCSNTP